MANRLITDRYEYDDPDNTTVGTIFFTNGESARIERCLPAASMIKGLENQASETRAGSPQRKFLMGVLNEIYRQAYGGQQQQPIEDPYRKACLEYALNCGWLAGDYGHNLSEDGESFTPETLLMARTFLEKRGDLILFTTPTSESSTKKGYEEEDALLNEIKFDPPEVDSIIAELENAKASTTR